MGIDVLDYLSHEEIKEIVVDELQTIVKKDAERLLSNFAYNIGFGYYDKAIKYEDKKVIREKVKELIHDKASYYGIFRKADAWEKEDSKAYLEVKKAVEENIHIVHEKVKAVFENYDYENAIFENVDIIQEAIIEIFKRGVRK